ncbi:MAG: 4Fe-4S dicluster domain-containing protein [Planctomycetes bacterium]|nr:4Fe-4S dicluster domain-containing protein [Planctomycetota bacterium]
MGYFGSVLGGMVSLATGMTVTLREFGLTVFKRKSITMQYPREKPTLSPAYRSAIKLIRFEDTGTHDCVACKACERVCPSFCIKLDGGKVEGIKKKRVAHFEMDFALCSLCGLCLDVCPTDTLEYSQAYDEVGYNRDWRVDLLAEFRDYEPEFIEKQRKLDAQAAAEKAAKMEAAKAAKEAKEAKAAKEAAAEEPKKGEDSES